MVRRTLLIVALTLATGLVGVNAASALGPIDLLTDANIRIDGAAAEDDAGTSVSGAGDVNGDGGTEPGTQPIGHRHRALLGAHALGDLRSRLGPLARCLRRFEIGQHPLHPHA